MTAPDALTPLRVVIDTSVVIPILVNPEPERNWLCQLWQSRNIEPLLNSETRQELEAQLKRASPTVKEYPAHRFAQSRMRLYQPYCREIPLQVVPDAPVCRDPNDQMFVELAIAGRASFLISRDDDLIAMGSILNCRVCNDQDDATRNLLRQATTR